MTIRLVGMTVGLMGLASLVCAGDRTWSGGGDANWSTAANWGGTAPSSGDALIFAGTVGLTNTNDLPAGTSFGGITFASNAGAFTLTGNGLALSGDVTNWSANAQALNIPFALSDVRVFCATNRALTLNGALTGAGGFTKTGTQYLTLTASNSYEGVTTVAAGRLSITDANALGSANQGTVVSTGAALELNGSQGLDIREPLTLVNYNPGSLYVQTGTNYYRGLITITGGQARIQNQAPLTVLCGGITSVTSTVIMDSGGGISNSTLRIADNPILASGQKCFFHGSRIAVLAVAGNTVNDIEVSGGSLLLEVPNAWPANLTLEVGVSYAPNSFIDLQGNDQTIGSLTGINTNTNGVRTVTSSTGPATLTVNQSGSTTFNSNFGGKLSLVKLGAGTLAIAGTNCQQSGQTVIGGGKLSLISEQNLGVAPEAFVANHLVISNAATLLAAGPLVIDDATRGITLGVGNGTFETALGADITVSNAITGVGGLTKAGAGTLSLAGVNDFAGVTTVSAGILQVAKKASLYNGAALTADKFTVAGGATLLLNVGGPGEFVSSDIGGIATQGTSTTGLKSNSWLALNVTNAPGGFYAVGDVIGNPSGGQGLNLQKMGLGTLALTGMNTYTGVTKISQGVLSINSITTGGLASAIGQSSSYRGNLVFDGGALQYTGPSTRTDRGFTYAAPTNLYVFDVTQANTVLNFGALSNAVFDSANTTLVKTGPGTLLLGKGTGSLYNFTLKSIYVMGGALLTEPSPTSIQQNVHAVSNQGQGPALLLGDGAILGYNAPLENYVNGTEMLVQYVGTQQRAQITSGQLTLCGPTNTSTAAQSNTHIFDINDGADDIDLDVPSELNIYTSLANSNLRKTGAGTLRLRSSLNAYAGITTVRSGRLSVTASVPLSGKGVLGNASSALQLGDAGTQATDTPTFIFEGTNNSAFTFARGVSVYPTGGAATIGSISNVNVTFSGAIAVSNTLQLLSVTTGTNALFITGGISGPGGVAKTGTGTVVFASVNTYTGATTVAAGTLRLAASERIADASLLRLAGGVFNPGSYSETLGALDVDANSAIDFGGGNVVLTFSDSSAQTWTGKLVLRNWRSGSDHLFIGTSDTLTRDQLKKITSPSGQSAAQLSTGEIVLLPLGTAIMLR